MAFEPLLPYPSLASREHANQFLLGLIFNQGQRAEKSWRAPGRLLERLNLVDAADLGLLPLGVLVEAIAAKPCLHTRAIVMSGYLHSSAQTLGAEYGSDARRIWDSQPTAVVLDRLVAFRGIGRHKAIVGVCLLRDHFGANLIDDGTAVDLRATCPSLHQRLHPFAAFDVVNAEPSRRRVERRSPSAK